MTEGSKKYIFVFTGPDGSGRKTVADAVGLTLGLKKVISYTTRKKRSFEVEGQDYIYVSREEFRQSVASGEFVEHLEIDGNCYGIKEKDISNLFEHGSIYLIINPRGAEILKQTYGDQVVRIFLYADRNTVYMRQQQVGLNEEEIARHLSHYDEDMAYGPQCEHCVENINDLGHTVFHVTNVLEEYLQRQLVDKD